MRKCPLYSAITAIEKRNVAVNEKGLLSFAAQNAGEDETLDRRESEQTAR